MENKIKEYEKILKKVNRLKEDCSKNELYGICKDLRTIENKLSLIIVYAERKAEREE